MRVKILSFVSSKILKTIVDYLVEGYDVELQEVRDWDEALALALRVPFFGIVLVDGKLLSTAMPGQKEEFFQRISFVPCLLFVSSPGALGPFPTRHKILTKPFKRAQFTAALQELGVSLTLKSNTPNEPAIPNPLLPQDLSLSLKEELRLQAQTFLEDYCKQHFRSIAEEVLSQQIQRLAEERTSLLEDL